MEIKLIDTWGAGGTDMESLVDAISSMDAVTYVVDVDARSLLFLTYDDERSTSDWLYFRHWDFANNKSVFNKMSRADMIRKKTPHEVLEEMEHGTKLMVYYKKKAGLTSASFMGTVASRLQLGGNRFLEPSVKRDEYIAETIATHPFEGKMMFREIDSIRKIFAMHSKEYGTCKQAILLDLIDQVKPILGEVEMDHWEMTHDITRVWLRFPEKAADIDLIYGFPTKLTPGLYLSTSDNGDSSITVQDIWFSGSSKSTYNQAFKRRHRGEIKAADLIEKIKDQVFIQYEKVPERLCQLMVIDVKNPAGVYEYVLKKIGVADALGINHFKKLMQEIANSVNPRIPYSAYDIATGILELPESMKGVPGKTTEDKISALVIKAVFADYAAANRYADAKIILT